MSRDLRVVNHAAGQQVEAEKVIKRIGEISYRNLGTFAKAFLFDTGKALITSGLRVVPVSGMTVSVPVGAILQRLTSGDILPCILTEPLSVTLDAASGSTRIDIIECQVKNITDKDDSGMSILDSETGAISLGSIKRDLKYYLSARKQTNTTTATAATAGILTGLVAISGTINLSSNYLLNIADGEDGSFQEIDLRGAVPTATTAAEIVANINTAVGRTMASIGAGNVIRLTGSGTGITSKFEIKPPVSNTAVDALQTVFGISGSGVYDYVYQGENEWIKLSEIDMGAASTEITSGMIRNVDQKNTWASDGGNIKIRKLIYDSPSSEYDYVITNQSEFDEVFSSGAQLNDVSIFLHKKSGGYNLNYAIELQSNVLIDGDGALVNKNAAAARFIINPVTLGITSWTGAVFTMDSGVPTTFAIGDIVHNSTENAFYEIRGISGSTIIVDRTIKGTSSSSAILTKCRVNIHMGQGWKFNGMGNVHGLDGSYNSIAVNGGAFSISGCANSVFECEVFNFKMLDASSYGGAAYYGGQKTFQVIIKNIHDCKGVSAVFGCGYSEISNISYCDASDENGFYNAGAGVAYCNYSKIYDISYCYNGSSAGGGCAWCDYSIISNVYNCYALTDGGGVYYCNYCNISNIYNCTAAAGGGVYAGMHCEVSNIHYCVSTGGGGGVSGMTYSKIDTIKMCTAATNGGGVYACSYCIISNVMSCTANNGGGVYSCDHCTITHVIGCSATTNGGGAYSCTNCVFLGIWRVNTSSGSYDTISATTSIAHLIYDGTAYDTAISTLTTISLD